MLYKVILAVVDWTKMRL